MTRFSVLDLVPVREGGTLAEAFAAATDLARAAGRDVGGRGARAEGEAVAEREDDRAGIELRQLRMRRAAAREGGGPEKGSEKEGATHGWRPRYHVADPGRGDAGVSRRRLEPRRLAGYGITLQVVGWESTTVPRKIPFL